MGEIMKKLLILLCAVASLSVTACKKDAKEIQKIIDILGLKAPDAPKSFGKNPPKITNDLFDHFYVGKDSAGVKISLSVYTEDQADFQWYSGTVGGYWGPVETTNNSLTVTVEQGVSYYILELKSKDGKSRAYSNVCKIECGTDVTSNIGKIAMYNRSTKEFSISGSITYPSPDVGPVGIVCDVNDDGSPKSVVHYSLIFNRSWAANDAEGKTMLFDFNSLCGEGNYQILKDNVNDATVSGMYPAFECCTGVNKIYDGVPNIIKWYLPSEYEMMTALINSESINPSIQKFPSNNNSNFLTPYTLANDACWTSSMKKNKGYATLVKNIFYSGTYEVFSKGESMGSENYVRPFCKYE